MNKRPPGNPYIDDIKQKTKCYLWTDPNTNINYQIFGKNQQAAIGLLLQLGITASPFSNYQFKKQFTKAKNRSMPIGFENRKVLFCSGVSLQNLLKDGYKVIDH